MGFIGKLRFLFFSSYFPKKARLVNHDVYASCTPFWFTLTSENVEHS